MWNIHSVVDVRRLIAAEQRAYHEEHRCWVMRRRDIVVEPDQPATSVPLVIHLDRAHNEHSALHADALSGLTRFQLSDHTLKAILPSQTVLELCKADIVAAALSSASHETICLIKAVVANGEEAALLPIARACFDERNRRDANIYTGKVSHPIFARSILSHL